MKPILIVSATQKSGAGLLDLPLSKSIEDIDAITQAKKTAPGNSPYVLNWVPNNKTGLPRVYNQFLKSEYESAHDFIVFCHDDIYIDDAFLQRKLYKAREQSGFDIIGVAGGVNPEIKHPALWHLMCARHDQRGQITHPVRTPGSNQMRMLGYGPTPSRVVVADGCFLAVHLPTVLKYRWRFNENYDFHHYDISSCIDAHLMGMKIGVCPIHIFHQSVGLLSETPEWTASNTRFLGEYADKGSVHMSGTDNVVLLDPYAAQDDFRFNPETGD